MMPECPSSVDVVVTGCICETEQAESHVAWYQLYTDSEIAPLYPRQHLQQSWDDKTE